jgi:hypothetical protein
MDVKLIWRSSDYSKPARPRCETAAMACFDILAPSRYGCCSISGWVSTLVPRQGIGCGLAIGSGIRFKAVVMSDADAVDIPILVDGDTAALAVGVREQESSDRPAPAAQQP